VDISLRLILIYNLWVLGLHQSSHNCHVGVIAADIYVEEEMNCRFTSKMARPLAA
jgi:hypothetical protein